MHDIDRTTLEYGQQEYEAEQQMEFGQGEWGGGQRGVFSEAEEMELANQLLSVSNEAELEQFLGDFLSKAASVAGQVLRSPVGQAIGGVLKGVAKKALPLAGGAVGGYFGGPLGAQIGSGLASAAGNALGLEAEAMSGEDREFEGARQFVRLAADTVNRAAAARGPGDVRALAQAAATAAARQFAPGLLIKSGNGQVVAAAPPAAAVCDNPLDSAPAPRHHGAHPHSGRWMRHGQKIVLYGV